MSALRTYPMGYPLSHTPDKNNSIAAIARRERRTPREVAYDLVLEHGGRAYLMYAAAGYVDTDEGALYAMIRYPLTALGGCDAGAHVRVICDATHWVCGHGQGDRYHLRSTPSSKNSRRTARVCSACMIAARSSRV